jgi:hypothetical protein
MKRSGKATFSSAFGTLLLLTLISQNGCVSKREADARARAAFLAGQQQAAQMNRQTHLQGPTVTILGEVRNSLVRWTADLTLAKAVVAADYYGKTDPVDIIVQRDGKEVRYDPQKLLNGEDVQLEPNDVIELKH